jgi:hypothetical protein
MIAIFALWTLCANAVVATWGGLLTLVILFSVVVAAALALRLGRRRGAAPLDSSAAVASPRGSRPRLLIYRVIAVAAAVALAPQFAAQPDGLCVWWSAVVLLASAALAVCVGDDASLPLPGSAPACECLLWLLAAACVVVALISHRPDADDAFYVNVAAAAADAPQQALLRFDTLHGVAGLPLHLSVYRVTSYELLNGAVAYVTGIPALYCFHWLSAACAALLVPLAYARLFRILTPRHWLASVATVICVLLAVGETHRWYGNFALVRIWQGKAIALSVVLPLLYAYALRFAVRPNRRDWMLLAAAQIAAIGCSSSALWLAPASAVMTLCAAVRPSRQGLRVVCLGALASAYVLGAAWLFQSELKGSTGMPSALGPSVGPQLRNALVIVLGDSRLLLVGVAALLTGGLFAAPGLARRFAVVLPLTALLGLLSPYTAGWVTASVTGPPYWRSLWAVPVPILLALILTSPLHLGGVARPLTRRLAWLALLLAFVLLVPRYSGLSRANAVQLRWPGLKVPEVAYRWAVAVNDRVPPGSQVAVAADIGTWLVTLPHHAAPLVVRDYLRAAPPRLSRQAVRDRRALQRFVNEPELVEANPEQFSGGLDRFALRAVCLVNDPRATVAQAILQRSGFNEALQGDGYALWVRSGEATDRNRERR